MFRGGRTSRNRGPRGRMGRQLRSIRPQDAPEKAGGVERSRWATTVGVSLLVKKGRYIVVYESPLDQRQVGQSAGEVSDGDARGYSHARDAVEAARRTVGGVGCLLDDPSRAVPPLGEGDIGAVADDVAADREARSRRHA
jgi:hypothetical protein